MVISHHLHVHQLHGHVPRGAIQVAVVVFEQGRGGQMEVVLLVRADVAALCLSSVLVC